MRKFGLVQCALWTCLLLSCSSPATGIQQREATLRVSDLYSKAMKGLPLTTKEVSYLEESTKSKDVVICSLSMAAIGVLADKKRYSSASFRKLVVEASTINSALDQRIYLSNLRIASNIPSPSNSWSDRVSEWWKGGAATRGTVTNSDRKLLSEIEKAKAESDRTLVAEIALSKINLPTTERKGLVSVLENQKQRATAPYRPYWTHTLNIFKLRNP